MALKPLIHRRNARSATRLRPISTQSAMPNSSATASPSAVAASVRAVDSRKGAPEMTRGSTSAMALGLATKSGAKARTSPSHDPRMTTAAMSRGTSGPAKIRDRWAAGSAEARLMASIPPAREMRFEQGADPGQRHAQDADDEHGGENAGGVEALRGGHDEAAQTRGAQEELRRHHAHQRAGDRLAHAGHGVGQRVGHHDLAPEGPLARAVGARHLDQFGLDAARALDRVVEDRKHGEQEHHQRLGHEAEAQQRPE